jgi:hypothetical protein
MTASSSLKGPVTVVLVGTEGTEGSAGTPVREAEILACCIAKADFSLIE